MVVGMFPQHDELTKMRVSLYVGDLDPEVTEYDLHVAFDEMGPIASIYLCRDRVSGASLRYAYVNFFSSSSARKALACMNHTKLGRSFIRIMWIQRDPILRKTGVGNLFVKNLHPSITGALLQGMFCKYGTILSCKVAQENGKSKGFGFVHFEKKESAADAISALNGTFVEGKELYVAKFVKKSERLAYGGAENNSNLYVKNLMQDITEDLLRDTFSEFGKVSSVAIMKDSEGKSKGFGFVSYKSPEEANTAIEALNGTQLGMKKLYVGQAQKKAERVKLRKETLKKLKSFMEMLKHSNLYVKNLDRSVDESKLRDWFGSHGRIVSAKVMRDESGKSKGFGFVCFFTPEEAREAALFLNGALFHGKNLYVAKAQSKEERRRALQNDFPQEALQSSFPLDFQRSFHSISSAFQKNMPCQPAIYRHIRAGMDKRHPPAAQYHEQQSSYNPLRQRTQMVYRQPTTAISLVRKPLNPIPCSGNWTGSPSAVQHANLMSEESRRL